MNGAPGSVVLLRKMNHPKAPDLIRRDQYSVPYPTGAWRALKDYVHLDFLIRK
jgi:hypothetical protein